MKTSQSVLSKEVTSGCRNLSGLPERTMRPSIQCSFDQGLQVGMDGPGRWGLGIEKPGGLQPGRHGG